MAGTPGRPTRQGGDSSSWHCGGIARNSRDKSSAWWRWTEGVIGCSHDLCLHAYLYGSRQKTVQHETGQRRASTATLQREIPLLPRKARLGKEKVGIPSGRASLQRRGPRAEVGAAGKRNAAVAGGKLLGMGAGIVWKTQGRAQRGKGILACVPCTPVYSMYTDVSCAPTWCLTLTPREVPMHLPCTYHALIKRSARPNTVMCDYIHVV